MATLVGGECCHHCATTAIVLVSFILNCKIKSPPNLCQISTCFQIPRLHMHHVRVIEVSIWDMGLFFLWCHKLRDVVWENLESRNLQHRAFNSRTFHWNAVHSIAKRGVGLVLPARACSDSNRLWPFWPRSSYLSSLVPNTAQKHLGQSQLIASYRLGFFLVFSNKTTTTKDANNNFHGRWQDSSEHRHDEIPDSLFTRYKVSPGHKAIAEP